MDGLGPAFRVLKSAASASPNICLNVSPVIILLDLQVGAASHFSYRRESWSSRLSCGTEAERRLRPLL